MVLQITPQELEANLKHREKVSRIGIKVDDQWNYSDIYRQFSYFNPDGDVVIPIGHTGYDVALKSNDYGFPDSRTVGVDRRGRVTGFSPEAEVRYVPLFERGEVPLNEALEIIGGSVNQSMEYDVKAVETGNYREPFKDKVRNFGYTPQGEETVKGLCQDAGDLIRTLLGWTLRDLSLRYVEIGSQNELSSHDTTLVFDIQTGNWAVVNSKSPFKPFNLTPRERLQDLGYPYQQ